MFWRFKKSKIYSVTRITKRNYTYCDQYIHFNGEYIIWSNFIAMKEVIGNMCQDHFIFIFVLILSILILLSSERELIENTVEKRNSLIKTQYLAYQKVIFWTPSWISKRFLYLWADCPLGGNSIKIQNRWSVSCQCLLSEREEVQTLCSPIYLDLIVKTSTFHSLFL